MKIQTENFTGSFIFSRTTSAVKRSQQEPSTDTILNESPSNQKYFSARAVRKDENAFFHVNTTLLQSGEDTEEASN